MVQTQQEQLKKFFMALEKVSHLPGELYDMGLVVSDEIKIEDLSGVLEESGIASEKFILSIETNADDFLKKIMQVFENKKWLLVEIINGYLPAKIYNQLRLLSIQNRLQLLDLMDNNKIEDIKMPKESRVVFWATQRSIAQIANPGFINLFGPVIKI